MRSVWLSGVVVVGLVIGAASAGGGPVPASLQAAREALGGEKRLRAVKALLLQGTSQSLNAGSGQMLPAQPFEIRIVFPDHYLRLSANPMIFMRNGFAGDRLIDEWKPANPEVRMSKTPQPDQMQKSRAECARFMLGIMAATQTPLRLDVKAAGSGAGGGGDTLLVTGPEGFSVSLDLDPQSRVPLRVRYQNDQMHFPRTGQAAADPALRGTVPPPERAEDTFIFDDRRPVDGVLMPHRIREVSRDITFHDWRFEKIVINPPLTTQNFDAGSPATR
jgi:hypothetical protein